MNISRDNVNDRIFLSPPDMGAEERSLLLAAFDSNWVAPAGPDLGLFEQELAAQTGRKHAVALSSGTAAIHLGLLASGLQPGSSVAVSTFTFAGSINPLMYVGCDVTLIDSEPGSWNMDPELLEQAYTQRAAAGLKPFDAVLAVDLYGRPADYQRLEKVTAMHGTRLLSDAAESLGGRFADLPAGSYGDWAALSFNGNKIITTGGGGAFVTDDAKVADHVRYLSTQARQPVAHYEHTDVGYNYRMSNLLAAVGRGQLRNLPAKVAKRKLIEDRYRSALAAVPGVLFAPEPARCDPNHWLTCLTVDPKQISATPEQIRLALEEHNIETRQLWKPMHLQPVFAHLPVVSNGTSETLFATGLCLPSGSGMTNDQQSFVIDKLTAVLR
jgi:pyridoxal phosphate-dependent aminotransferase EpsN